MGAVDTSTVHRTVALANTPFIARTVPLCWFNDKGGLRSRFLERLRSVGAHKEEVDDVDRTRCLSIPLVPEQTTR